MSVIELKNCSKIYKKKDKKVEVLNNVSYSFDSGKFYAIMGESGCGKSTLVNSIVGFVNFDSGDVIVDGVIAKGDKVFSEVRNKKIGIVYQNFLLNDNMTAFNNVMLPMYLNNDFDSNEREAAVMNLFKVMGLENRINHFPTELSGGECQRVAIARSLVNNPKVIIADEPTGNLDVKNEKFIFNLLKDLTNDGKCVIVVSHNNEIRNYCDVLLELKDGKLNEIK